MEISESLMDGITRIPGAIEAGDSRAEESLRPCAFREIPRVAEKLMAQERAGHTLQPAALFHEANLRVALPERKPLRGESRGHFHGRGQGHAPNPY